MLQDMSHNSYLVSCADDKQLWSDLVKEGYGKKVLILLRNFLSKHVCERAFFDFFLDIYNVELILSGVMKQELEWNLYPFQV